MSEMTLLAKWRLLGAIMADHRLRPTTKQVAYVLLDHCNSKTGRCDPSRVTLARETGVDLSSVKRSIRQLVDAGWFRQSMSAVGRGHSNQYDPAFDRIASRGEEKGAGRLCRKGRTIKES